MKVGLIRGAELSPLEMQTYEHLLDRVDLEAYRIRSNRCDTHRMRMPVQPLACVDDLFAAFSPRLGFLFDRLLQAANGRDFWHFGLEQALADKDIAHTLETFNTFSWQALRAKQRHGLRLVVSVRENRPYVAERFAAKRRMKYEVLRGADLFLAMTPRSARCLELEGADPARIRVLPPGINTANFQPRPKPVEWQLRLGLQPDDFVFVTVAALRWKKGVYDLLHAFKRLTLDLPRQPLKLVFVGDGPEEVRLHELTQRLGLGDRVAFTRFADDEMPAVYNLADVLLLASTARPGWLEQFDYILAEALASGTPIIATQHGAIPEMVGEAAVLVPPSDFLALAGAMRWLFDTPAERARLARAGRARAEAEFDSRRQANRIYDAYKQVLG